MSDPAKYDEKKLAELMLYIALKCETHERFGAVKLNKILFFSDFAAYSRHGKAITGADYRRLELGPAPRRLIPVQKKLEAERAAFLRTTPTYAGLEQKRLIAMREPDLALFSAAEIAIVDSVIEDLCDQSAIEVSDRSHFHPGWNLAVDGESIPYETALLPEVPLPLTAKEIEIGLGFSRYSPAGNPWVDVLDDVLRGFVRQQEKMETFAEDVSRDLWLTRLDN